jgi:hypothetical protein
MWGPHGWCGPIEGWHVASWGWGGFMLCCHVSAGFDSLLMWVVVVVPCGMVCWGGPIMACHVAHWWDPPVRCLTSGWDPLADMDQWEAVMWHTVLRWLNQGSSRGMLAGGGCWAVGFFRSPNCTQGVLCPQIVPREILIKSQPLINSFNLCLSSLNLF